MDTIRMNGIRLSDPLAQVNQICTNDSDKISLDLCQLLSTRHINIEFLNLSFSESEKYITCCIAPDKLSFFQQAVAKIPGCGRPIRCAPDIGTLSVYPHKSSLHSIGHILSVIGEEQLAFCHMASSTSMLTFVVNCSDQEKIADVLLRYIDLPETHPPFRQKLDAESQLLLKLKYAPETAATYVESKIKTYGIVTRSDLTLIRLACKTGALAACGRKIQSLETLGLRCAYASAYLAENERIHLFLAIDAADSEVADRRDQLISSVFSNEKAGFFDLYSPVAAIHLQGPHFGDRYGIADQAFTPLVKASIPILQAGCVGASILMVLPQQMVQKAKTVLSEVFESP